MTPPIPSFRSLPNVVAGWRQAGIIAWLEPWYAAYAFLAVVQGGMLPVLLPLSAGNAGDAGLLLGAMNIAGLGAPYFGHLADQRRWHRHVLLAGLLVVTIALAAMPLAAPLSARIALALLLGFGFSAANTVSNMFIVEVRPEAEWDARIGALQACSGVGQVTGLLVAGLFGTRFTIAFGVAAALVAMAVPIAWRTVRDPRVAAPITLPVRRDQVTARAPLGGEGWTGAPNRHFHRPTFAGLGDLLAEVQIPFVRLLLVWFAAFTATTAAFTMFPLAMLHVFAAAPKDISSIYAIAAAVSLPLYGAVAALAHKRGALLVLRAGFAARVIALTLLSAAILLLASGEGLAYAAFGLMVIAWPALGVSGTALAASLAPVEKGEAIGLFNAATSLAGAAGALLGGWAMQAFGYGQVCAMAAIVVAVSALVIAPIRRPAIVS